MYLFQPLERGGGGVTECLEKLVTAMKLLHAELIYSTSLA